MDTFSYGEEELAYLAARDARLAWAIGQIGFIERSSRPDLFAALVNSIVGQQISSKAQETVWARMSEGLGGEIRPASIYARSEEELQAYGISFRKARYIRGAAEAVLDGRLDFEALETLPDDEVCRALSALDGIGVWTAEMLMLFSMGRPDVVSFGDFAILRGMRMLYRHRKLTRPLFSKYRRRYSPYGSVASLYLWAIAGGAIPELNDPAPKLPPRKAQKATGK